VFLAVAAGTVLVVLFWPGAITNISSASYLPHGECFFWNGQLIALHVVSDGAIFLSYSAISITLAWLAWFERKRIPFNWLVVGFVLFIVACGFTHLMDIVVLWHPLYWLAGDIKLVTAVLSVTTAVALPFVVSIVRHLLDQAATSRRNERRFQVASDSSNDAFFILESVRDDAGALYDFRFAFANAKGGSLVSQTPQSLAGKLMCEIYPMNRSEGLFDRYAEVVATGVHIEEELPFDAFGINASWLFIRVHKLDDGLAITTTDISARKASEFELERLAAFQHSIITSSPFATIVTDLTGRITSVNPAAESMLGYDSSHLLDHESALVFLDPQEVAARAAALTDELGEPVEPGISVLAAKPRRGCVEQSEWNFVRRDGSRLDALLTVSALSVESGQIAGLMLVAYDVTERKRMEAEAAHVANHDALTELPNRTLFRQRFAASLSRARANGRKVALLMIDLDGFKLINDSMGHRAGDDVLAQIAKRLLKSVRRADTVARLGGDEFVVVLDDVESASAAERMAERLLFQIGLPIEIGVPIWIGVPIGIEPQRASASASIGIALYPDHGEHADTLLSHADLAMYRAKGNGTRRYGTFDPAMLPNDTR
jgi:diguanylate cyclase (GGDEF)-like protein/PAS domain S-box-containing protein